MCNRNFYKAPFRRPGHKLATLSGLITFKVQGYCSGGTDLFASLQLNYLPSQLSCSFPMTRGLS